MSPRSKIAPPSAYMAAVFLLVLLAYWSGLSGPFFFDDAPNLTGNTHLLIDVGRFDEWRTATLSSRAGRFYRPVAMFSFAVNYAVAGGFSPLAFKIVNLIIHLVISLCVYRLCLLILRTPAMAATEGRARKNQVIALTAACIWGLHPLHVSTVLYTVQRMAQFSALFVVLGLVVFMHFRVKWAQVAVSKGELVAAFLWLALITCFALLSKENGVLLLWLIPVLEVTLFRGQWHGRSNPRLYALAWIAFLLPLLIIITALIVEPSAVYARFGSREFTLEERLLTQLRMLWYYLGWLAWPDIRSMGFHHDDIALSSGFLAPITTLLGALAWVALLLSSWALRRRWPLLLFAVLFFLTAHSMESSFLPLEMVFEHRNYLPSVGVMIFFAFAIVGLCERYSKVRLRFALTALVAALFILTSTRAVIWSDALSLARFNVVNHPFSPRANFFYGQVVFEDLVKPDSEIVDADERQQGIIVARSHFRRMHELSPRDFAALVMLHQIDASFFPEMPERQQWVLAMLELAESRRIQASDRTAIDSLVEFSLTEPGLKDRLKVEQLLQTLLVRYPYDLRFKLAQYHLLAASEAESGVDRLALLEQARLENPGSIDLHFAVARHQIPADMGAAYMALGEGMKRDVLRRDLTSLRRMFEQ